MWLSRGHPHENCVLVHDHGMWLGFTEMVVTKPLTLLYLDSSTVTGGVLSPLLEVKWNISLFDENRLFAIYWDLLEFAICTCHLIYKPLKPLEAKYGFVFVCILDFIRRKLKSLCSQISDIKSPSWFSQWSRLVHFINCSCNKMQDPFMILSSFSL